MQTADPLRRPLQEVVLRAGPNYQVNEGSSEGRHGSPGSPTNQNGRNCSTTPVRYRRLVERLPDGIKWIRGQLERGEQDGYLHYQVCVAFDTKQSLAGVLGHFPGSHAELSKSSAANDYVWKDATCVAGTKFEFGAKPILRSSKPDWESVWEAAKLDDLARIPAHIRVVNYRTVRAIAADFDSPRAIVRRCFVFHGPTGTGKSHRAWSEGGLGAYSKDPKSKFWCGYRGEDHVVVDEFRGGIDISHLLRWLDRYPVRIHIKNSSRPLVASCFWITSNVDPNSWYPDADHLTVAALLRRLIINPDGPIQEFT